MTATVVTERPSDSAPAGPTAAGRRVDSVLWQRISLAVLLVGTGVLYLWNLSINGWANSFYSAAIQAGSQSWKAWFFGSSDMANSITVDKPPASLWIPAIVVRIFGLNSWSILVPQALMGVASVALLYLITRKYFGHWAGILAGLTLALVPVSAMMFRFNNPEALLILLMIASVWAILKAVETGRLRWLILTGVFVGFGFLTKQLQVMLIVPPLAITYLAFGPRGWLRRLGELFASLAAMIVSAGWWLLTVELWPVSSRPWIGGSQDNSILELTLGYNGLGRLNGNERGSVMPGGGRGMEAGMGGPAGYFGNAGPGGMGGPGGRGSMWGETGFFRMFEPAQGGQIAWLIPTGLIVGIAALVVIGRAARTDMRRAYLVVWGLWLLVTMAVFSYMAGIFHSYYTAALAPAVAAVVAGGAAVCWQQRQRLWVRIGLAAAVWVAAIWGFVLLDRSPDFVPWLRYLVLVVGLIAGGVLIAAHRMYVGAVAATLAILAGLAGPLAYTIDTVATAKQGSIISAGPRVAGEFGPGGMGGPGHHGGRGDRGMPGGMGMPGGPNGMPGMPGATGQYRGMGGPGGPGGLLNGTRPSAAMVDHLTRDADQFTWMAAAVGSNEASGYQLDTGYSVMPIGGFNGTDPSPTLEQFQKLVAERKIHFFIGGGRGFGFGGSDTDRPSSQIRTWVTENFTSTTIDGVTIYDLTSPK
ncbi:glycosyl transferase family 39 [Gordonia bronchialis DSM 43247]|uniref:Glycosyl transferase family 39 n=1 Tax=Gordonia bronchialis (strain ATCC 25592 / DSM 43247 / BCRC 13721 / JCM 3198 / KCTC 3076 / NBRC 16047 / NCTC 10667) TaxID=526226 RepID=D0L3E3_GORB4|nr:glycosyltransferase family 39 protein [Gordonia bronchialis]ACY20142.1 glycosyl transferase family 39 [Gordonia bronchialis DSM 43247]MCC3322915.1 glycosyltransferase family 39 protein [Gordonia bronchialis]QGS26021.1 glycosyl transferase [Gordonia bronchialis]UAK37580.1 glycosyltransferase family 39 protein [Gordonia bronchialis]STQ62938.1 Predicted membrane protein [Gordonia bronchialis]